MLCLLQSPTLGGMRVSAAPHPHPHRALSSFKLIMNCGGVSRTLRSAQGGVTVDGMPLGPKASRFCQGFRGFWAVWVGSCRLSPGLVFIFFTFFQCVLLCQLLHLQGHFTCYSLEHSLWVPEGRPAEDFSAGSMPMPSQK